MHRGRRSSRGRRAAGLAVLAAAATACGSTVQATSTTAGADNLSAAATAPAGVPTGDAGLGAPTGVGTPLSSPGATGTGGSRLSATGPQASAPATTATAGGPRAVTSAGGLRQGVGVTANAIYVGVTYLTNGDAANAALGASGVTEGDQKADAAAVIADINAHGGVAGRKLVGVYHAYDANSTAPYATQDQAACADFTQDHHVYAVTGAGYTDDFTSCIVKSGALDIDQGEIIYPDETFLRQNPDYFNIGTMSQDRMMGADAAALLRMGYFGGWNPATGRAGAGGGKIGVISYEMPEWERPLTRVFLPALARAGHPVAPQDIYRVPDPSGTADTGRIAAGIQSATLRFRQDGVTHVIIFDTTGGVTLFFTSAARSQHYFPRLGVNSGTGMQALFDSGVITNNQLNGAVGLGWLPVLDLPPAQGNKYGTSATRHCLHVMKQRTGQTYDSTNAASLALGYCDQLYVLADALNRAGPVLNQDTGRAALEAIGNRFTAADLPGFFLSPTRHDAAQLGYDMRWNTSCQCAQYVGGPHVIP